MKFNRSRRQQRDEDLGAEIRSHPDESIRERIERNETPDDSAFYLKGLF